MRTWNGGRAHRLQAAFGLLVLSGENGFINLMTGSYLWLIGLGPFFGPLQLYFQPFGPDLEPVHRRDGVLGRLDVIERHKAETLGQVRLLVYEHLGGYDGTEREECRRQIGVGELLGQVVDEQVAAFWTYNKRNNLYNNY